MKRNQKMKVLAFSMFAGIVAASVPQVKAADIEKYVNKIASENEAQIVMSLNSSSTNVHPGDKFTVALDLTKLPDNGEGVGSISFRLAYDATKVTAAEVNGRTGVIPDLKAGPVGTALGMKTGGFGEADGYKTIAIAMGTSADESCLEAGNVLSIEFTALDTVTPGDFEMFMVADKKDPSGDAQKNIAGFAASGVEKVGDKYETATMPVWLNSNLDQMKATVEAQSVRFNAEGPIGLDNTTKNTANLGSMLLIDPTGAQGNTVTWNSSNPKVATVDANGTVTAVDKGTTTISATVDGKTASITIVVTTAPTKVDFDIDQDLNLDVTTRPTTSLRGNVVIDPVSANDAMLTWTSSDETVATVDQNGKVTAVGNGQCEIKVKYGEGNDSALEDTITVKVTTSVKDVSLEKNTVVLDVEDPKTTTIGYTLNPTTSQPRQTTVTSSDPSIVTATVDETTQKITLTAQKYGTAKVTLTVDGKTASVDVKVTVPLSSIVVDTNKVEVYKGETKTVKVTADPTGSAWESLKAAVKTGTGVETSVNQATGVVTFKGLNRGNATVAVYANDDQTGAFIKEVAVEVKENRITSLTLAGQEEEFLRGKEQTLKTTLAFEEPESVHPTTDKKNIIWASSDEKVATVDQNGKVTAIAAGTATITATMPETANKISQTYEVEVVEYPLDEVVIADEDVKTLEGGLTIAPEEKIAIPFTVSPEECTDTKEEIIEKIMEGMEYDEDLVDVEVSYDPETGKGTISITAKADGEGEIVIPVGTEDELDEEGNPVPVVKTVTVKLTVATPNADTSDIPVAATAVVMIVSLGGIVVSKKVLVK